MSFLSFMVFFLALMAVCAFASGVVMAGILLCIAAAVVAAISGALSREDEA